MPIKNKNNSAVLRIKELEAEIKELKNYIKEIEMGARGLREKIMDLLAQRTCDVLSKIGE